MAQQFSISLKIFAHYCKQFYGELTSENGVNAKQTVLSMQIPMNINNRTLNINSSINRLTAI